MSQLKNVQLEAPFHLPKITEADLFSFHEAHFGDTALDAFAGQFCDPNKAHQHQENPYDGDELYYEDDVDDDRLGYYPDGVKRTLTDEQISMFRHSEIQALHKARDKAQERRDNTSSPFPKELEASSEDGEVVEANLEPAVDMKAKKKKKNKKRKRGSGNGNGNGNGIGSKKWEPDPERRKRTWDVVETGLDALDYGEMGQTQAMDGHVARRRRITYDDD